jgi:hypothetical protein
MATPDAEMAAMSVDGAVDPKARAPRSFLGSRRAPAMRDRAVMR